MNTRLPLVAVAAVLSAGCGGADAREAAGESTTSSRAFESAGRLARNGISLAVPDGWDGRILFREPTGRDGVLFQVASFELPANEGLEPPRELAPGDEDPIKAMRPGDILVMVADGADDGAGAPSTITVERLARVEGPRVPHGHSLAERSFCFDTRCVEVTVEFGAPSPGRLDVERADDVLASLAVAG